MAADLAVQVRVNYVVACNQERHMFRAAGMISIERTVALLTHFAPLFLSQRWLPNSNHPKFSQWHSLRQPGDFQ